MGEHTRKYYTCDRCGIEIDQPVRGAERGPTAFTMYAHSDMGVAGGYIFKWEHLCVTCNGYVGGLARKLHEESTALKAEVALNTDPT